MADRRFARVGEYELFLDEEGYDAFLNGANYVRVSWYGWHRVWKPNRSRTWFNGRLFRRGGRVMLDLLLGGRNHTAVELLSVRSSDFISFVAKV